MQFQDPAIQTFPAIQPTTPMPERQIRAVMPMMGEATIPAPRAIRAALVIPVRPGIPAARVTNSNFTGRKSAPEPNAIVTQ